MGKKKSELIPKPRSNFIKVKCPECNNEQPIFEEASIEVKCNVCSALLCEPTGGKIALKGTIVERLE